MRPAFRGRGIGKALLKQLAQRCVGKNWRRFEWSVLDWNEPSIEFYESIGAKVMHEWKLCRHSGARARAVCGRGGMTGDCKIVLVVAIGENGVIGRNGKLPWRLQI